MDFTTGLYYSMVENQSGFRYKNWTTGVLSEISHMFARQV